MQEIKITRINIEDQTVEQRIDFITEENPIHIFLNNHHYGTILCTPNQLKEMVIGHLHSEGLVKTADEIENLVIKEDGKCLVTLKSGIDAETLISTSQRFARLIVSSCGAPNYRSLSEIIRNLPKMDMTLTITSNMLMESVKKLNP